MDLDLFLECQPWLARASAPAPGAAAARCRGALHISLSEQYQRVPGAPLRGAKAPDAVFVQLDAPAGPTPGGDPGGAPTGELAAWLHLPAGRGACPGDRAPPLLALCGGCGSGKHSARWRRLDAAQVQAVVVSAGVLQSAVRLEPRLAAAGLNLSCEGAAQAQGQRQQGGKGQQQQGAHELEEGGAGQGRPAAQQGPAQQEAGGAGAGAGPGSAPAAAASRQGEQPAQQAAHGGVEFVTLVMPHVCLDLFLRLGGGGGATQEEGSDGAGGTLAPAAEHLAEGAIGETAAGGGCPGAGDAAAAAVEALASWALRVAALRAAGGPAAGAGGAATGGGAADAAAADDGQLAAALAWAREAAAAGELTRALCAAPEPARHLLQALVRRATRSVSVSSCVCALRSWGACGRRELHGAPGARGSPAGQSTTPHTTPPGVHLQGHLSVHLEQQHA